jgi:hypothetical protein
LTQSSSKVALLPFTGNEQEEEAADAEEQVLALQVSMLTLLTLPTDPY